VATGQGPSPPGNRSSRRAGRRIPEPAKRCAIVCLVQCQASRFSSGDGDDVGRDAAQPSGRAGREEPHGWRGRSEIGRQRDHHDAELAEIAVDLEARSKGVGIGRLSAVERHVVQAITAPSGRRSRGGRVRRQWAGNTLRRSHVESQQTDVRIGRGRGRSHAAANTEISAAAVTIALRLRTRARRRGVSYPDDPGSARARNRSATNSLRRLVAQPGACRGLADDCLETGERDGWSERGGGGGSCRIASVSETPLRLPKDAGGWRLVEDSRRVEISPPSAAFRQLSGAM
jgi:hypothetical protein